jgi:hypothetical protein
LLTPRLAALFAKYKAQGATAKKLSSGTEDEMRVHLGEGINDALDGILDLDSVQCMSCAFILREKERQRRCEETHQWRLRLRRPL